MNKIDSIVTVMEDLGELRLELEGDPEGMSRQDAAQEIGEIMSRLWRLSGFEPYLSTDKVEFELRESSRDLEHPLCILCHARSADEDKPKAVAIKGTRNFVCDACAREHTPDLWERMTRQNRVFWEYLAKGKENWEPSQEGDIEILNTLIAEQSA